MPKRAWCSGCRSYVMLNADDICPYGHPKPSLRGVEEVGYGAPPSQPERRADSPMPAPYDPQSYAPATTTSSDSFSSSAIYNSGATSGGYGSAPVAVAMPGPAFQSAGAPDNPWQSDIDAVSLNPALQTQLNMDAHHINSNVPWSQTWPGILVWLFFFTPVGLFFLWRSPMPKASVKWAITGVFAALVIFNLARVWLLFSAAAAHAATVHP